MEIRDLILSLSNAQTLNESHRNAYADLIRSSGKLFKVEDLTSDDQISRATAALTDERSMVFGLFHDQRLIASIAIYRWTSLPYFTLGDLKVSSEYRSYLLYKHLTEHLIFHAIRMMENEMRFTFYAISKCRNPALRRIQEGRGLWAFTEPFKDYNLIVEAVIPPDTRPVYPTHWELMCRRTHPVYLWIRRGTLKQEHLLKRLSISLQISPELPTFK